jgi:LacI family transcriptional regulator
MACAGEGLVTAEAIPPTRPVTLADIAREAGTSPATASRALSGRGYVSAAVRARTVAAAERLGYVPNASARTLRQKASRAVGVAVSDLANPFYARLAAGIEQTLRDSGYQMIVLSDNSESDAEVAGARTFLAMRAPGVILTPAGSEAAALLARHGVAVVEVDRRLAEVACDAVVIDNERGALAATSHLLSLGHERVALLVAETDWTTDAGRLRGYLAAHEAAGLRVDDRLIVAVQTHARDVDERISALLDVEKPTALFAANNQLAEQAWRVLRRRGLRLPTDVSLVGFDDVPWMEMVEPGITAVSQPTIELGRRAARLLLRRIARPDGEPTVEILQPTLIVRGSSGPLRLS